MVNISAVTKVLIVRTLQSDLLLKLLQDWKQSLPGATFSILTHPGQMNLEYYRQEFEQVFIYDAKRDFSPLHIRPEILKAIRQEQFDLIIFPKKMDRLEGFENVLLLLATLGGHRWAHCGIDGVLRPVSKWHVLRIALTGVFALILAPLVYTVMLLGIGIIAALQSGRTACTGVVTGDRA